jgi:hypothetical protein
MNSNAMYSVLEDGSGPTDASYAYADSNLSYVGAFMLSTFADFDRQNHEIQTNVHATSDHVPSSLR